MFFLCGVHSSRKKEGKRGEERGGRERGGGRDREREEEGEGDIIMREKSMQTLENVHILHMSPEIS